MPSFALSSRGQARSSAQACSRRSVCFLKQDLRRVRCFLSVAHREQSPFAAEAFERRDTTVLESDPRARNEIFDGAGNEDFARFCLCRDACADVHGDSGNLAAA